VRVLGLFETSLLLVQLEQLAFIAKVVDRVYAATRNRALLLKVAEVSLFEKGDLVVVGGVSARAPSISRTGRA